MKALLRVSLFLLPLLIVPIITQNVSVAHATPTPAHHNARVNFIINYGNGTMTWYNHTKVPRNWNFFNVTSLVTDGNIGALFFPSFGSHFVYLINGVGCPGIFNCDHAWSFWTLDGICWDSPEVGVDQVSVNQTRTAGWILSPVSEFGQIPPSGVKCLNATIEVKPSDPQKTINVESDGTISVAILATSSLDPANVDPSTVRFGSTGTEARPTHWSLENVNGDGKLDLVLHFKMEATRIRAGDTLATLMGRTLDGTPFRGTDTIHAIISD